MEVYHAVYNSALNRHHLPNTMAKKHSRVRKFNVTTYKDNLEPVALPTLCQRFGEDPPPLLFPDNRAPVHVNQVHKEMHIPSLVWKNSTGLHTELGPPADCTNPGCPPDKVLSSLHGSSMFSTSVSEVLQQHISKIVLLTFLAFYKQTK